MTNTKKQRRKNTHLLDDDSGDECGTYVRFDRNNNLEFWWDRPNDRGSGHNITISEEAARSLLYVLAERFSLDGLAAV